MAVGKTSEAKSPIQVAGGSPGWQVAESGRDAMTSHPFEAEVGSRRVLASLDDIRGPYANGRDGNHVPT